MVFLSFLLPAAPSLSDSHPPSTWTPESTLTRDPNLVGPRLDGEGVAPRLPQPHVLAHHGLDRGHGRKGTLDLRLRPTHHQVTGLVE